MSLPPHKIKGLFYCYLDNGFSHTVDEIAKYMHISRKTFFNRYHDKENSVALAIRYWHLLLQDRFRRKCFQCNHSVEEIMLFISELHWMKENESSYYAYEFQRDGFWSPEAPFLAMLNHIFDNGIRCYHFQASLDRAVYSRFLLYNLTHYFFVQNNRDQVVQYLLKPLLTERGEMLFREINMDILLF